MLDGLSPCGATAAIGLPRCFVESLGLHRQSLTLIHKIIQLLSSLEDGLNRVVEDDLGVIEICLKTRHGVGLCRILELSQVNLNIVFYQ